MGLIRSLVSKPFDSFGSGFGSTWTYSKKCRMFWHHLFDVSCSEMDANRKTDYYARSSYHRYAITRVMLAPNDVLTPFDLRTQNFRVNVELSAYYRGREKFRKMSESDFFGVFWNSSFEPKGHSRTFSKKKSSSVPKIGKCLTDPRI